MTSDKARKYRHKNRKRIFKYVCKKINWEIFNSVNAKYCFKSDYKWLAFALAIYYRRKGFKTHCSGWCSITQSYDLEISW